MFQFLFKPKESISPAQMVELFTEEHKRQLELVNKNFEQTLQVLIGENKAQLEVMRQHTHETIATIVQNSNRVEQTLTEKLSAAQATSWQGYEEAHSNSLIRVEKFKQQELLARKKADEEELEWKKLKAAYALNMCMVSLSQIVDYQDINVLHQEYNAILNNLNIENIIKDEALLDALKKILDTCHFYILHEKDKAMLKKKQAARLKGALGKALGGGKIIAVFSTPNPWAIVAAAGVLAGSAIVSYKSEKSKAQMENEVEEWELEKSALEQLHNLRRTLFETTWRLAATYKFKDKYRLTEKQIAIYNQTITDPDPLNRYERLNLLQDNFEAYPLFWYYQGRAALEAAELYKPLDAGKCEYRDYPRPANEKIYMAYRKKAKEALDQFIKIHAPNQLLREDVIAASAYIDSSDFYLDNPERMKECIDNAREIAGLDLEIIQTCAFRYGQMIEMFREKGNMEDAKACTDSAIYCLRLLLNEDYNPDLNGRALSQIYIEQKNLNDYLILKDCISSKIPFVYTYLLKWSEEEYQRELENYFSGGLLCNTIGQYFEGRCRCIMSDFYQACYDSAINSSVSALEEMKENYSRKKEAEKKEEQQGILDQIFMRTKNKTDNLDFNEICTIAGSVASFDYAYSIAEGYIGAVRNFINDSKTYERRLITVGLKKHDINFEKTTFERNFAKTEALLTKLIQAQADLFLKNLHIKAEKLSSEDFHALLLDMVTFMTQESLTMKQSIQDFTVGKFRYKNYINQLKCPQRTVQNVVKDMMDRISKAFNLKGEIKKEIEEAAPPSKTEQLESV